MFFFGRWYVYIFINRESNFFTMRKVSLMLCLLMMTAGLSGCLGGSDVETSEGDDVVPGD